MGQALGWHRFAMGRMNLINENDLFVVRVYHLFDDDHDEICLIERDWIEDHKTGFVIPYSGGMWGEGCDQDLYIHVYLVEKYVDVVQIMLRFDAKCLGTYGEIYGNDKSHPPQSDTATYFHA